jgi:hypothetical protein
MLSFKQILTTMASAQTLYSGIKKIRFTSNHFYNLFSIFNLFSELIATIYITTNFTWLFILFKICDKSIFNNKNKNIFK